jgi:hypothetical protein
MTSLRNVLDIPNISIQEQFKIHTRPAISSKRVADNLPILISADNLSLAFFLPSANVYAILPGGRFKSGLAKKVLACKRKSTEQTVMLWFIL